MDPVTGAALVGAGTNILGGIMQARQAQQNALVARETEARRIREERLMAAQRAEDEAMRQQIMAERMGQQQQSNAIQSMLGGFSRALL